MQLEFYWGNRASSVDLEVFNVKLRLKPWIWALGKPCSRLKEERGGVGLWVLIKSQEVSRKKLVRQLDKDLTIRKLSATLERKFSVWWCVDSSEKQFLSCSTSSPPLVSLQQRKELNLQSALLSYVWMDCSSDSQTLVDKTSFLLSQHVYNLYKPQFSHL